MAPWHAAATVSRYRAGMVEGEESRDRDHWIGPYRLLDVIGEGGMGVVYLAEQQQPVRRRVALKIMRVDRQGREFAARFDLECKALERMAHPNVARVLDAGVAPDGRRYLAMEHVAGLPVDEYCDKKRLTIAQRLDVFRAICAGVQHAHTNGVMHRDLKPSNILVTEVDDRPVPKIIDFGLARAIDMHGQRATVFEELQRVVGTLAYMSPEQAGLEPDGVDTRTDVYSLGVLLNELLTGRLPFDRLELEQAGLLGCQQIIKEREPAKPSSQLSVATAGSGATAALRQSDLRAMGRELAGDLDWIVMKALQKDRERRYETVRELARDIERHQRHEPVEAGPPSVAYRLRKWLRRHRRGVAAGAVAMTGVLGGLIASLCLAQETARANARLLAASRATLLAGDPLMLAELTRREKDLWPAMPESIPAIDEWLAQVQELLGRQAEHQAALLAGDLPGSPGRWRDHLRQLEDLARAGGLRDQLQQRRERAATIAEQSLRANGRDRIWQECIARVRTNARYTGLADFGPQLGLVPIEPDRVSTLEEFAVLQSGEVPLRDNDGKLHPAESDAIVLVLIPGGVAIIGASPDSPVHRDADAAKREGPVQQVRLDPYLIGKYEVTQAQWVRVMGSNPSNFRINAFYDQQVAKKELPAGPSLLHPVEQLSWYDAVEAMRRLDLVLPTEARWEYAARAGSAEPWHFFRDGQRDWEQVGRFANIADAFAAEYETWPAATANARLGIRDQWVMSAPVGSLAPNANGLHDMHGNVWEWCLDGYDDDNYERGLLPGNGMCRVGNDARSVLRGGCFESELKKSRVSWRELDYRVTPWYSHGLRAARALRRGE
jgi:serine/threonine protein kinase/formylglycine-generating enzyme required for sulfatase activity